MTLPEVIRELERLGTVAIGIQQRYEGHFALHRAACVMADRAEIATRRDELHTLLDALLDNGESIQVMARRAAELSRS